ncbi:SDR family oxidoreductase [Pseudoalteromonas denitrificans]|uniref:NAD(P)-dependent dehydrogenase, short-chain alcohol dehydrogenase family n=1 Tax=Pseudoalteromonas denitrificans DSM 6059 TaxID=1123010 RepID=A0A1I1IBI6_9GAMM|nr:SDR family oxidoreductase [Pseudoalteromonas denitrificans]SFC31103.1 NAD(P)-dependent dehydrogenase, short-chain alcohol dehydrogenase family [Pseudoalteromonas denitrificans DSM 6059]
MYNFSNKKIIVTGITGGIAHASVKLLASLGAEIIVTARTAKKLELGLSGIEGNVSGEILDLTDSNAIKNFFDKVGSFDHLVTPAASSSFSLIKELDLDASRKLLETKQWGQLLCVHYALPHLKSTGSITLFSGTVTQKPLLGATMFASAGAATEAAGRIWAHELAPIRVNTVVPGVIETRIWGDLLGEEQADAQLNSIANTLPVKRIGTAEEVAKAVAFLIDNGFVNGISLVIDGGHRLI